MQDTFLVFWYCFVKSFPIFGSLSFKASILNFSFSAWRLWFSLSRKQSLSNILLKGSHCFYFKSSSQVLLNVLPPMLSLSLTFPNDLMRSLETRNWCCKKILHIPFSPMSHIHFVTFFRIPVQEIFPPTHREIPKPWLHRSELLVNSYRVLYPFLSLYLHQVIYFFSSFSHFFFRFYITFICFCAIWDAEWFASCMKSLFQLAMFHHEMTTMFSVRPCFFNNALQTENVSAHCVILSISFIIKFSISCLQSKIPESDMIPPFKSKLVESNLTAPVWSPLAIAIEAVAGCGLPACFWVVVTRLFSLLLGCSACYWVVPLSPGLL